MQNNNNGNNSNNGHIAYGEKKLVGSSSNSAATGKFTSL